jgi:hypothetical protein
MNWLPFRYASQAVVLAVLSATTSLAIAGDAIIFPSDSKRTEPSVNDAASIQNVLKPVERMPSAEPNSFQGLALPNRPGPRKLTLRDKKMQDARDERENWLLLRPGQLTDKYDQGKPSFGVREDDFLKRDKDAKARDYLFPDSEEREADAERNGEPGADKKAPRQYRADTERGIAEDQNSSGRKQSGGSFPTARAKQGEEQGAHISKELDLKGFFTLEKETAQDDLKALLSEGAVQSRSPERQARLEEFNNFVNSPRSAPLASDSGGNIKLPNEFSRPAMTPGSSLPESPFRSGSGGADFSMPSVSRGPLAPSASDWSTPRATRPGNLPSASSYSSPGLQPITRPSVMRPTVLEIPQRKM